MPLPLISAETLSPAGQVLPLSDYFNPTLNTNFTRNLSSHRLDGITTIGDVVRMATVFSTPECIAELIPAIIINRHGPHEAPWEYMYTKLYNIFPEDLKYLVWFSRISFNPTTRSPYRYRLEVFYPTSDTSTWNWSQTSTTLDFNLTFSSSEFTWNDDESTRVTETLSEKYETIRSRYTQKAATQIGDDHPGIPFFVKSVLRFGRDASIYYPQGNRESFPVDYDWARPSHLVNYIAQGYQVSTKFDPYTVRVYFSVRPNPGDRRHVRRLQNYSTNVLDLIPYTIKGPKEPKAVTYGVELEACGDYTVEQLIDAQKALFFICKSDGSIWGDKANCYELVTVPASLKAHKRLWAEFFEKVDYNLFDCSKYTGNGMHVHIGRSAFSSKHLNRFTWFITNPSNEDFILAVSERPNKKNLDEWAPRPNHFRHSTKIAAARNASATNSGLRGAIHYKRQTTVEVRLFKGIVSYATIVKNLEFIDSVYFYTQETMLSNMNLRGYLSWLKKTPKNQYQMLKAFLSEVKIEEFLISSDVSDLIWSEKQDNVIVQKLNKAPFKITNTHITILNKKRRKRTFILKDGKAVCITPSGGLLAKLDKSVQQKQIRGAATFAMTSFS